MLKTSLFLAAAGAAALAGSSVAAVAPDPYVVPVGGAYDVTRVMSVGDTVPETGDPSSSFRLVGIPDGLGAHRNVNGTVTVYVNHEFGSSVQSEPVVGAPLNRGAFVSKLVLEKDGTVLSGERAYDTVFAENTLLGPAPEVGNATRAFSRFCSGFLAGPSHGFDRYIYLTNEEEGTPSNTFDGLGGLSVAIFDDELHTLPKLGRFAKENTVVQRHPGNRTVIVSLEDGPAALDAGVENSQLYLYVGTKERQPRAGVLRRKGLDNGKLYVLVATDSAVGSEADFADGVIGVKWVEIPGADTMSEAELEAASDAAGALRFARPEDGAFDRSNRDRFFFVTTGGAVGANELGRLYSLRLHPGDPTKAGTLTVVYNADEVIDAGGDIAISPDNIDVSSEYLMINEDGTTESRAQMQVLGREGSIWRFELDRSLAGVDAGSAERVAELDPPGYDGIPVPVPGTWETSGIIDTSSFFGGGTWLFDVQAHSPTTAPAPNTVADGQLLLLRPAA